MDALQAVIEHKGGEKQNDPADACDDRQPSMVTLRDCERKRHRDHR
jgi:hypothetical protein